MHRQKTTRQWHLERDCAGCVARGALFGAGLTAQTYSLQVSNVITFGGMPQAFRYSVVPKKRELEENPDILESESH